MSYGYDIRQTSDVQSTLPNNSAPSALISPPLGAQAMLISVVTTDIWLAFGGTPSATVGHVIKKDQNPLFIPAAEPFKFLPTANAATVLNITWLY